MSNKHKAAIVKVQNAMAPVEQFIYDHHDEFVKLLLRSDKTKDVDCMLGVWFGVDGARATLLLNSGETIVATTDWDDIEPWMNRIDYDEQH